MTSKKKIVIIGIDGLDYQLTSKYLKSGFLPNLNQLKKDGFYSKLETTTPPQSPVAWATFITGASPNKHGIFDFIVRDPQNYLLSPVFSPVAKSSVLQADPFWRQAAGRHLPTKILFLPVTYPPEKLNGKMLSGMGTPDILGTEGTFTLWTTEEKLLKSKRGTRIKLASLELESLTGLGSATGEITSFVPGPKVNMLKGIKTTKIPVRIAVLKDNLLQIKVQGQQLQLIRGQFSDWVKLKFKLGPFRTVSGLARFFLKSVKPHLTLYLSPINIDPRNPIFPISYPTNFAQQLVKKHGLFTTLGLPHDTWALQEGIFSDDDFLQQAEGLLKEKEKIIFDQLAQFKGGLFVAYFGTLDSLQHMFFKDLGGNSQHKGIIPEYYQKMDALIGKTRKAIDKDTVLIVLSDHGFAQFNWEVNLNTWLKQERFLTLKSGSAGQMLYENVDWSKTKAFAAGFNSIYLNLKGREAEGIVARDEMDKVVSTIKTKLTKLKQLRTHLAVVKNVYLKKELSIPQEMHAPDLIVGYSRGFRASWETAVGAIPAKVFNKRTQKWSGDHLFDASEVPGVIFSNSHLKIKDPYLGDVMPYVLSNIFYQ